MSMKKSAITALLAMKRIQDEKNIKIPKMISREILIKADLYKGHGEYYFVTDKPIEFRVYGFSDLFGEPRTNQISLEELKATIMSNDEITVKSQCFETMESAKNFAKKMQKYNESNSVDTPTGSPVVIKLNITESGAIKLQTNQNNYNPSVTFTKDDLKSSSIVEIGFPDNIAEQFPLPVSNIEDIFQSSSYCICF